MTTVHILLLASQAAPSARTDVWTVISTAAAAVAALAALAALWFAWQTVMDGKTAHAEAMEAQAEARSQFAIAHAHAMQAQRDARDDLAKAHNEAMDAERQGRDELAWAHNQQMAARERAQASDVALQRLAQAGRIGEVLSAIMRTARDEQLNPPQPVPGSQRPSFIPSQQAHLRSALALFYALGGPRLATADELAGDAYSLTTEPITMLKLAQNSLGELTRLAGTEDGLRLEEPASS